MELSNSKRLVYTASHVTTELTEKEQKKQEATPGRGIIKANYLKSLSVTRRDIPVLRGILKAKDESGNEDELRSILAISEQILSPEHPILTPDLAKLVSPISEEAFLQFGNLVIQVRSGDVSLGLLVDLFNYKRRIRPIGWLHLERVEMYPAGVEKGELVFSVPMAPGETVTISHKEWSTSTQQFEDIVEDYFESYSERGVAEKTDASMASENEKKHASTLNFGASASGTFSGVTLTTSLGISNVEDDRQSVKNSMQQSREVTEKASARSRKEHKVSVKLETKRGVEDSSFRTITNAQSQAVRIDYYRMMRKWRTDLFRYGLRLTYDITIPTPGVRIWGRWQHIRELDKQIAEPFSFPLKPDDIKSWTYRDLAIKWGTTVQDPPPETIEEIKQGRIEWLDEGAAEISRFDQIDLDVPAGYFISATGVRADLSLWPGKPSAFNIIRGIHDAIAWDPVTHTHAVKGNVNGILGKSGHLTVVYAHRFVSMGSIELKLTYQLAKQTREKWQFDAWKQLRAAAEARHQEDAARLRDECDALWRLLNGKDTLSLRRLEREELLRLIILWLSGPTHPVVTTPIVEDTIAQILKNESMKDSTFEHVSQAGWFQAMEFGRFVQFIHQAVEWENLVYFYYPYFWGSERLGPDKMLFEHSDPEHERFLRAGYARIVVTVRPGFEKAFTNFVESGSLTPDFLSTYVTVAEDIANFAKTNYAGIPPANPELQTRPLLYPEQRATWETMQTIMADLESYKTINGYPSVLAELPGPALRDAWGNEFVYRKPGLGADYDLVSLGASNLPGGTGLDADISSAAGASLVATWSDYTPTSALDIEVDTKPEDIA